MKISLRKAFGCFFLLFSVSAFAACPVSLDPSYEACEGDSILLDSNGDGSYNYQWFFNGSLISGEDGPTLLVTEGGDYEVNATNGSNTCSDNTTVNFNPLPLDTGFFEIVLCDDTINGSANNDEISTFDLTSMNFEITNGDSSLTVTWYETEDDVNNDLPIADPTQYQNIVNPQTIFYTVQNEFGCFYVKAFFLSVTPLPNPASPTPLTVCDIDGDGFVEFDLNSKDMEIANGETNVSISYFATQADAESNIFSLASPYTNIIAFNQIVFVRVEDNLNGCTAPILELELIVLVDCPIIDDMPLNLFVDEGDNDGFAIFDLTVNEAQMLGGQDPLVYLFSYHLTLDDSELGINEIATPMLYQNIENPQIIYVRLTNSNNGSYALTSFEIETDGFLGFDDKTTSGFTVYPNPASGHIFITSSEILADAKFVLYDINGRVLLIRDVNNDSSEYTLDISSLRPGLYFLEIETNHKKVGKKIVKR